ncbi:hypothetical protein Tco_0286882, partial [Tanacetum coccineum]
MERKRLNFQPRRGVCVAEKCHNGPGSNMVMSRMTNVAKPGSSDARCNILASFGESKGISTMNPSCDKVLDVEEEAWSNKEPSGQNVPFNANGQNVSFNANGQNVSPNHVEFNVSFNANGQNVSHNHAEFNVFPNSANGLNVIPNQNFSSINNGLTCVEGVAAFFGVPLKMQVDYENFAKGIERGTYQPSEFPSLVRTSDNDGRTSPSNLNSHANVAHFWESIHHVEKEISAFADANSDYDDEAPVDDGANTDVEALLRDFSQRMDSLARQGASLRDASTHGVDAMSNSNPGNETIPSGTDHVTHVETDTESEFLIQNIDDLGQTMDIRSWISDLIVEKCNNLLELQKKATMVENKQSDEVSLDDPIVKIVDVNDKPSSYVSAVGGSKTKQIKPKANFHPLSSDNLCEGASISIPRNIVETVSSRLANKNNDELQ